MELIRVDNKNVLVFSGEDEAVRTRAIVAAGYLCVDANRISVSEDGMSADIPLAAGVTAQYAMEFIRISLIEAQPLLVDQKPL
jgi:hypothetical protein